MSQYFSPQQRTRRYSSVSEETAETSAAATASVYYDAEEIQAHQVDLEQSIYIFPNPGSGSGLSSPFTTSSELSVPTDISFPPSTASGSQTRDGRGRRTNSDASVLTGSGSGWDAGWDALSRRSVSADTHLHLYSPTVEVWDMQEDEDVPSGASSDIGSAELEDAIERASRWDVMHAPGVGVRYPLGRQPFASPFTYAGGRFQYRRRLRRTSSASFETPRGAPSLRRRGAGHGAAARSVGREPLSRAMERVNESPGAHRLPLLSVLCSLLALDDATLHLLTRPAVAPSASPLFPGPRLLSDADPMADEVRGANGKKRRNLARLGALELESVKEGIEVACDSSVTADNKLALPLPSFPILDLWNIVTGVCSMSIRAWSNVRRPAKPIPTPTG